MRILAIDSSGLVATVAVVEEENKISKTIAEYTINYKGTGAGTEEAFDSHSDSRRTCL